MVSRTKILKFSLKASYIPKNMRFQHHIQQTTNNFQRLYWRKKEAEAKKFFFNLHIFILLFGWLNRFYKFFSCLLLLLLCFSGFNSLTRFFTIQLNYSVNLNVKDIIMKFLLVLVYQCMIVVLFVQGFVNWLMGWWRDWGHIMMSLEKLHILIKFDFFYFEFALMID